MTQEEAEKLEDLVINQGNTVRYTGGPYVNSPGHIRTNDDGELEYYDDTYAPMLLKNVSPGRFSVYIPIVNWWKD